MGEKCVTCVFRWVEREGKLETLLGTIELNV